MHFYPHNIGDFNNATRHLTRVERSVYRDAIELYYDTESMLTNALDVLCRKLLCNSEHERDALILVLSEFFDKTELGYRHERCEIEIEKYRANTSAKARAGIASAAKRKQNSTRVEHVNNECATKQEIINNNQETLTNESKAIAIGKPNCPHEEIIKLYHEILPSCPSIRDWTPARQGLLRARWNESEDRQNVDYWRGLFEYISKIPFLTGQVTSTGRKPFFASLDWIVKAENFAKIREGRYD